MPTKRHYWGALLLLLGTLILTACGSAPVSYATGARDTVVRLSGTGGGMLPGRLYYYEGQFPPFTLFGDGTLVYAAQGGLYQAHLDDAAIQKLLQLAVNDAHFFDLPDFVGPTCCDMPGSSLTISANGQTKTVSMSLLDETTDANSPERRLRRILDALTPLQTGHDPTYTPAGAMLHAEPAIGQPSPNAPAWPLKTVSLAAVAQDPNGLHLTGADAQAALQAAPGVGPFVENGVTYLAIAVPDPP
jgi:hypothetical protein